MGHSPLCSNTCVWRERGRVRVREKERVTERNIIEMDRHCGEGTAISDILDGERKGKKGRKEARGNGEK